MLSVSRRICDITLRRINISKRLGWRPYSDDDSDKNDANIQLSKPLARPLKPLSVNTRAGISEDLVDAANQVANHLNKSDPTSEQSASLSLLQKLKQISSETKEAKTSGGDFSSLYSSLSVKSDKEKVEKDNERVLTEEQKEFLEKRRSKRRQAFGKDSGVSFSYASGNLFGAKPLGIFPKNFTEKECPFELKTWKLCLKRDVDILTTPRPKNFLEETIRMTEKGMLWQLPLNNEFGVEENELEPFHQHIFLDKYVDPWCPKSGPIRHFMELVTVGLSKNPYMTIYKKHEHIKWFEQYFTSSDKQEIFKVTETDDTTKILPSLN